ncbi:PIN domain-like protein, partial [Amanita rubescens]
LTELSMMEGFVSNRRGLRSLVIGISARAWIVQRGPTMQGYPALSGNAPLSSAFYRLSRLLEHPIIPVFVFDSVSQASQKRGRQGQAASQQLAVLFQHMVRAFGFNVHQAPAGAEEELAALCRNRLIDIVITDSMFTFMFGATHVIHDTEFLNSTDDMATAEADPGPGPLLSRGNWILLALLVGNTGGGHGPGLHGCGLATALQIIKSNLGAGLLQAAEQSSLPQLQDFLQSWRCNLQRELADDPNHHLGCQDIVLAQAVSKSSFPSPDDIVYFVRPITSLSNGQLGPDTSLWVPRAPDLGRMGHICERLFSSATCAHIAREFDRHVWPGTCMRLLLTVSFTCIGNQCLMN